MNKNNTPNKDCLPIHQYAYDVYTVSVFYKT